jgi:ferric-dicitrate binding protein FerR (iron transport regulator)
MVTAGTSPSESGNKEKAMFTNPAITADPATQHRRELTGTPARPMARRVIASLAVAAAVAAVLMTAPVGGGHLAAHYGAHYAAHYATGAGHYATGVGHYA